MIDLTDIIALVLAALFAMRRMETRGTQAATFPQVPPQAFEAWKGQAIRARTLAINACAAKVIANTIWYFLARNRVGSPGLQIGGYLLFFGWVAALSYTWWLSSAAKGLAERLGIAGRRMPQPGQG